MSFLSKVFKEIKRPLKQAVEEVSRVQGQVGIGSDLQLSRQFELLGDVQAAIGTPDSINFPRLISGDKPKTIQSTDPFKSIVQPPTSFGGDVLSARDRLRRASAKKRGLRSTNITGGIRGPSSTVRPTLMTL